MFVIFIDILKLFIKLLDKMYILIKFNIVTILFVINICFSVLISVILIQMII